MSTDKKISDIKKEVEKMKKKYGKQNNEYCVSHSTIYWILGILLFIAMCVIIYFVYRDYFSKTVTPIKTLQSFQPTQ